MVRVLTPVQAHFVKKQTNKQKNNKTWSMFEITQTWFLHSTMMVLER